jgi:hypothetical protein
VRNLPRFILGVLTIGQMALPSHAHDIPVVFSSIPSADEIRAAQASALFPSYLVGPETYLAAENRFAAYATKAERDQKHKEVIDAYFAAMESNLGRPTFAQTMWSHGNAIARLARKNSFTVDKEGEKNILNGLAQRVTLYCESRLKAAWDQENCKRSLLAPLTDLTRYFWQGIGLEMKKHKEYAKDSPENFDKYIQNVEYHNSNSPAWTALQKIEETVDTTKRLAFITMRVQAPTPPIYVVPKFPVGADTFNGKTLTTEHARNYLHGAVTNEYANRVAKSLGHPYLALSVWHNVNSIARLRRNNNIFVRNEGVNLRDKTDYHLAESLLKFCKEQSFSDPSLKDACLENFHRVRGVLDELNEAAWEDMAEKLADPKIRAGIIARHSEALKDVQPGTSLYEDRLADLLVLDESRNPNSRINRLIELLGAPGQTGPSYMKWFLDHGYKPDPTFTLVKATDTKTISEPSFIWEVKAMLRDPSYITPHFETSPAIYQKFRKKFILRRPAGLVRIPLNPASPNLGPCGSHHYTPDGGAKALDAYAAPITACAFGALLQTWKKDFCPDSSQGCRINWGDISHRDRTHFNDHGTHTHGNCIDIRPFRSGKFVDEPLSVGQTGYDAATVQKFLNLIKSMGATNVAFNDATLDNRAYEPGHHNHIHFCLKDNKRTREVCNNFQVDRNVCSSLGP